MTISPDIGYLGDRLHVVVDGLRPDLGPTPSVYFSPQVPLTGPAEVTVTPGSIRQLAPGKYQFEIAIALSATGRRYAVVLTKQPGISDTAGTFIVRAAYRLTGPLPRRHHISLALTPLPSPSTAASSPPAPAPAPVPMADAVRRILDAEANLLTALAQAAPQHVHCADWIRAAAKKECCAARVLEAVATLAKTTPTSQALAQRDPIVG